MEQEAKPLDTAIPKVAEPCTDADVLNVVENICQKLEAMYPEGKLIRNKDIKPTADGCFVQYNRERFVFMSQSDLSHIINLMQFKIGYADLDYIPTTEYNITCSMTSDKSIFFSFDKISRNDSYSLMGCEKFFEFVRDYLTNGRGMKFRDGVPGHTINFKHIRIDTVDESAYKIARTVAGILTLEQQDLQGTNMYLNYYWYLVEDSQIKEDGLYLKIAYYRE